MEFLNKQNLDRDFLSKFISGIIEIEVNKDFYINVDQIFDKISSTEEKKITEAKVFLDTLINKYNLSHLEESMKNILTHLDIKTCIEYITIKNKSKSIKGNKKNTKKGNNEISTKSIKGTQKIIKDTQKSIMAGGTRAEANRRIVDAILYGINTSHEVTIVDGVVICQYLMFIVLILLILKSVLSLAVEPSLTRKLTYPLVAFTKLWYNIVGETIVHIDNPVVEINLPYDSASKFDYFDHDPYAWMGRFQNLSRRGTLALAEDVAENAEDEIMRKIGYFKTLQKGRNYNIRYLFNKNNSVIEASIKTLERQLDDLLEPKDIITNVKFVDLDAVSRTSIFHDKRFSQAVPINDTDTTIDPHAEATAPYEQIEYTPRNLYDTTDPHQYATAPSENDIVMASVESGLVPMGNQTKDILLTFVRSCLEYLSRNNTISGGTLKTRRNKKRKNRTKKNKR